MYGLELCCVAIWYIIVWNIKRNLDYAFWCMRFLPTLMGLVSNPFMSNACFNLHCDADLHTGRTFKSSWYQQLRDPLQMRRPISFCWPQWKWCSHFLHEIWPCFRNSEKDHNKAGWIVSLWVFLWENIFIQCYHFVS